MTSRDSDDDKLDHVNKRARASVPDDDAVSTPHATDQLRSLFGDLRDVVARSCAESYFPFKNDPNSWGVTNENDARFTAHQFGDFKSANRAKMEEELRKYMREPSEPRGPRLKDFAIAVTIAAQGSGKTRLVDDALRVPLSAKPGETAHFDGYLRLAVTFNGNYGATYAHPVSTRMLLAFFCGVVARDASIVLKSLDGKLKQIFPEVDAHIVALNVLDALERFYFEQRGNGLGRSVLLIDEIGKAGMINKQGEAVAGQQLVYDAVVAWLNGGALAGTQKGRRGAVFTGLSAIAPWSTAFRSGRSIVRLPLGTFDLWDKRLLDVVDKEAKAIKDWPADREIPERVWYLLAATGGRPRDVSSMLERLNVVLRRPPAVH
jgi:hypothetical protein